MVLFTWNTYLSLYLVYCISLFVICWPNVIKNRKRENKKKREQTWPSSICIHCLSSNRRANTFRMIIILIIYNKLLTNCHHHLFIRSDQILFICSIYNNKNTEYILSWHSFYDRFIDSFFLFVDQKMRKKMYENYLKQQQ